MQEPTLIIMAAGMGSRYGGLKQMDPIGPDGELIIDFSLYDAMRAGFKRVVFVIKDQIEDDFKKLISGRADKYLTCLYAFQRLDDLPKGFTMPAGREKPWGTCHAVLSCADLIDGPFAVINADDFYGAQSFQAVFDYLKTARDDEYYRYCMAGYRLDNTLTDNGHVARGVCRIDSDGFLTSITERTKIMERNGQIQYEDEIGNWISIQGNAPVSMNFWGFTPSILTEMERGFSLFLEKALAENPLKGEYYLPLAVDWLIKADKATVKVLPSSDRWFGVTYKEDRQGVADALRIMKENGIYPKNLWQ